MKKIKHLGLHPEKPAISIQPDKPFSRILLDCLLSALLLCGLLHCCVTMYRLPVPELPLLLMISGLAVLIQLCPHWRKRGAVVLILLGILWAVVIIRNLSAVIAGALLLINKALDTLSVASHGQYDFGTLPTSTAAGYTAPDCMLLSLLLLFAMLAVVFSLLIHYRLALLCTLFAFALLTPALSMTIVPPTKGIVLLAGACGALFALQYRSRRFPTFPSVSRRGWLALPAALLVAGMICTVLQPAHYVRPQQLENLRGSFENAVNNISPKHAFGGLANSISRINMQNTDSVSFSGKTMLRVSTTAKEAQYLKSFCGTNYSNSSWSLSNGSAYDHFLQNRSLKGNPYLQNNIQTLMSQYEGLKRTEYNIAPHTDSRISIENVAANSRCTFVPYGFCSLPEGSQYNRDLCAHFSNLFGKNSYTIPFYFCSDMQRRGTYTNAGDIASYSAGNWPIPSPSDLANLIFTGNGYSTIMPDSLDLSHQNYLFAWQTKTSITPIQREALKLYSCQPAYASCSLHSGRQYTYADGAASYLLSQENVDKVLKQIANNSKQINPAFDNIDKETFLSRLQSFPTMDLKQFYTQPLYPLTKKNGYIQQDPSSPVQLKTINSDIGNFLEYEYQYRKAIYTENTQVPDTLRPKLVCWLKDHSLDPNSTAILGCDSEYSTVNNVVTRVKQVLASSCQYTLSPGAPPTGIDFVDYFLNENHYGYCVHFASAATLLLRTLGIPARYAEGYYIPGNELNGRNETINVTDNQAHAWVEVYSPGLGWIPFEATPGYTTLSTQNNLATYTTPSHSAHTSTSSTQKESSAVSKASETSSENPTMPHHTSNRTPAAEGTTASTNNRPDLLITILCMAALLAAVILLRHAWSITRRRKAFTQPDTKAAGAAVYTYLQQLVDYGVPISEEARQLCEKALFSKDDLTSEEMAHLCSLAASAAQQALARQGAWRHFVLRWLENVVPSGGETKRK